MIPSALRGRGRYLRRAGKEEAGTKEHSVPDDWTKSLEGGKQFWKGAGPESQKRGVSVTRAETCDWQGLDTGVDVGSCNRWMLGSREGFDPVRRNKVNSGKGWGWR